MTEAKLKYATTSLAEWEELLDQAQGDAARAAEARAIAERAAAETSLRLQMFQTVVDGLRALKKLQEAGVPGYRSGAEEVPAAALESGTVTGRGAPTGVVRVVDDSPRGQEAIRRILRDNPRPWAFSEIFKHIRAQRWIDEDARNPQAAVRVALRRLVESDEVEKTGVGRSARYRYKDSPGTPDDNGAAPREAADVSTLEEV